MSITIIIEQEIIIIINSLVDNMAAIHRAVFIKLLFVLQLLAGTYGLHRHEGHCAHSVPSEDVRGLRNIYIIMNN